MVDDWRVTMPENQNIEYKESWRDDYLKWICGFANAQGGKLYIGINDKESVVGIKDPKKLMEDIPNKIRDSMGIIADVNLLTYADVAYLEIIIPPYPVGISYKGHYYYRSGSTLQILSGPALETFLLRKRGAVWDNLPLPAFTIDVVDDGVFNRFKELAARKGRIDPRLLNEPKEVLIEKLRLVNGDYLTNAAMLLFCKEPDKYQLGSYIKIGYFENDADLLYQDEIHGSLIEQVDKALEVIYLKYMRAKITYEGVQRIERYFVPEEALREALFNAICHKKYESCVPIQVSVYEDKLYVANICSLPYDFTADNLMQKHASNPYNPNIANTLYLAGFIESWGRGVEKICDALSKDGLPMPEYTVHQGDIMIKFTGREDKIVRVSGKFSDKVNDRVNDRVNVNVNDREIEMLNHLNQDPGYTVTELAEKMSVSRKTIAGYLKDLKELGIIERIGSSRKGYWKINEY